MAFQQEQFQQALLNQRLNTSEMFARNKHGDQVVAADQAEPGHERAGAWRDETANHNEQDQVTSTGEVGSGADQSADQEKGDEHFDDIAGGEVHG